MHVFFPTELVQYPRIGWFTRKYQSIISPGLLLAGLLLKVAILSKKTPNFWGKKTKNVKKIKKNNDPTIPMQTPKINPNTKRNKRTEKKK